ncbi:gliding motility-associated C-terminal domain-containing protein, partial [Fulvivirga imtechensis]|uniref:T9SS type B sorting domain-containing protein n=1 Tax=Fulvivirga imtechensis TaxID=881893 RepID=UPI00058E7AB7
ETEINIDPFLGCNNTPVLLIPPIDRGCTGVAFFHNPGAYDPDGDSISFELVVPKKEVGTVVDGYVAPNAQSFYNDYNRGNETFDGQPTFSINPTTGELKWNAPGAVGEYNIAFVVREFRKINGEWFRLGFVTRDMQIIIEDCDNERPELQIPEDICVEAGETIDEIIFGTDPDGDNVKIEAFSQVFDLGAVVDPQNGPFQPSVPPAELRFTWNTECVDIRDQPYQVVFKITDNPEKGPKLVSFATWNITVVGPKPDVTSIQQDGQGITLDWNPYFCSNAEILQVWRRVDSNPYSPDECETGIRENAGYQLIDELPVNATSYKDTKLASAAKYCYRILAIFPQPSGGESIVSDEVCFEFVPAEEPIITNVSVVKTGETDGQILVGWREPYEIDVATYPRPYIYKVFRAEGFNGSGNLVEVHSRQIDVATTNKLEFTDTGLNTAQKVYNYRIQLIAPNGPGDADPVQSAVASSVWLEPTPQFKKIELTWQAEVPWSNSIALPPDNTHLIYRGLEGDTDDELVLIDEVDIMQNGFVYIDSGQYNNTPLVDHQVYCYKVLTKGTYGNPEIASPLLNFSQMVCAQPSDSIAPCKPVVSIDGFTCEEFLAQSSCNFNEFQNVITWTTEFVGECQDDIQVYRLYYAPTTSDDFSLLAEVRDTSYVHDNLSSFKGCYKVMAIDRSGNESEFSEVFCVDNCPYYELPNVFTPGNGDDCNELFSAYGSNTIIGEDGSGGCGPVDASKCARFVKSVKFTVYNRWGGTVYTYQSTSGSETNSGQSKGIYIGWNGRNNEGNELPAGVYYYLAEVTFDVVDPSKSVKKF